MACAIGLDQGVPGDAGPSPPSSDDGSVSDGSVEGAPVGDASLRPEAGVAVDTGAPGEDAGVDSSTGEDSGLVVDTGSFVDTGSTADTGTLVEAGPPDSGCSFTGVLATYDLSGLSGITATAPATSTGGGVTAGSLARSSALTAASASGGFNSSNWSTNTSADPTKYDTFTVTPPAGCTLSLTSLALDTQASSSGPAHGDVATSADTFATHVGTFAGTSNSTAMLGAATKAGAMEIRIYGYGATASGGTLRLQQTMTLTGSLH
jgi:hypothetical protein